MPFSPHANPDLAGQFMYAGISQAGSAIAEGAKGAIEGFQKKSKERKAYMGLGEAMVTAGEMKEEQWEALKNSDTDTLKGTLDGLKAAGVLKQLKLQNQLSEQQINALEFHVGEQKKTAAGQARFSELMQARMTPPEGPTPSGEPLTAAAIEPNEIYGMAAKARLPMTRDVVEMGEAFERYGRPGTVTPVPGQPNLNFVWQTPKSGSLVPPASKTAKVLAPAEEWIVTDDVDLFKEKITAIKDPQTRDAILAARRQYNLAIGKTEDPLAAIIAELLGGKKEKTEEGKGSKGAKAPEKKPLSPWERYKDWGK
jgi:hypothetical protein